MKITKLLFVLSAIYTLPFITHAQILSDYAPVTIAVSRDTSVNPQAIPVNTSKIAVFSSGNFSGVLTANPASGRVTITDAKPVGNYTITVKAFSSSGTSSTKTFSLIVNNTECSDGRFSGNFNYPIIRPNLTGLAIGDFNGDDKQDLLAAHLGYNSVSIRLGNGTGGFTGNTEEGVSSHPYSLAVGDFDRDGKQDFIVSNEGANLIAVRLGNGAGAFGSMPNVPVGTAPAIVALGDFNNDAKLDFAVANFQSNTVSIRLGDGSGNFSGSLNLPVGSYPEFVAVEDINHDGNDDILVSNSGSQSVSVRLGNGNATFTSMPDVPVGYNAYSIGLGDFNSDGNLDMAVSNFASNTLSLRFGDGTGAFTGSGNIPIPGGPYSVTIGNFNGDGHLDLAVTIYFQNKVSILLGDGAGGFTFQNQVAVGSYPVYVVAGDFNGDRRQDLAVANYTDHNISVRLGINGTPSISPVASNSPVCEGQTVQFYSTGGNSFLWSGPNGFSSSTQNPVILNSLASHSGIYSLSFADNNNCSATVSTIVRVNPPPLVSSMLVQDSICSDDAPIILSGGIPAGGVFSGPGVLPGNIFDPALVVAGNYYLNYSYTDANHCSSSAIDKISVLICTGRDELDSQDRLTIYPNPAKDFFYVNLRSKLGMYQIELFNIECKLVRRWNPDGEQVYKCLISDLPSGVYFLKYNSAQGIKMIQLEILN
ncbi:MAG: T9SS type A sorting domain-containing protein [Bacteroidetes bacterium]|nr:MAG: T9SS type A sorting domain-containing protein [Bacteroidota bacterium]